MAKAQKHAGQPCPYCWRVMVIGDAQLHPTRDHQIPRSKGGTALLVCCVQCNVIKRDLMPDAWARFMAANPKWWLLSKAARRRGYRAVLGLPSIQSKKKRRRAKRRRLRGLSVRVPPDLVFGAPEE